MSSEKSSLRYASLAALLLVAVAGCKKTDYRDALQLAPVHGSVICRGKPLSSGQVVFVPKKDTVGVVISSTIQNDGSFKMETAGREGALIGQHRVIVRPYRQNSQKPSDAAPASIPERYQWAESTPLQFEVKPGQNEYTIKLD